MSRRVDLTELFGEDENVLDKPVGAAEIVLGRKVPNVFPSIQNVPYRIAIIGEAPGKDEEHVGIPFVGWSGKELDRHLSRFSIARDACFIGNICQYRPPANKLAAFEWTGPEISEGIHQLTQDLHQFRPNIVLLLGGAALHVFRNPLIVPKKKKTKDGLAFVFPDTISDWRGSFFLAHPNAPCPEVKCIASYHPAAVLRTYEWTPYLLLDIQRCKSESTTKEISLPQRSFDVGLEFHELVSALEKLLLEASVLGTDIEGYWNNWKCISFAPRPDYALVVPFVNMQGESLWTVEQEAVLFDLCTRILSSPRITKVWQNGLYDRFVLQYGYSVCVRGPSHDIMLKHWELYCEMEKSLSVQCSLYTKEPFYKSDISSNDQLTFWRYCGRDGAVTKEIDEKLEKFLSPSSKKHYEFNLALLNSLLYMELRGIRYDSDAAAARLQKVEEQIYTLQASLDRITGYGLKTRDKTLLRALVRDTMCYKRDSSKVKADYVECYNIHMERLLGEAELTDAQIGHLSADLKLCLNVKGEKLKDYLYKSLGLPMQYDPVTGSVTADYEALLTLSKKSDHPSLPVIITIAELRTRQQMLRIATDPDGRIRSSYNEVGSETGRVTSLTSPTGSGYNLQTVPDENDIKAPNHPLRQGMRDLLLADEDCFLGKCDLRGADGWTIGANLASLGYPAMLDDLKFGLKPASILCVSFRRMKKGLPPLGRETREELLEICKEVKKRDWDYFALKQYIWGCCLTGDHEVLTPNGWVRFDSLEEKVPIAVWSKDDYSIKFEVPSNYIKQDYTGALYSFSGNSFDLLATADHRMPFETTTMGIRTTTAATLNMKGCRLPKAGHWKEGSSEPLARLVAAIQSDGHYDDRGYLSFTFRKERKVERMKQLLDTFHVKYSLNSYFSKRDQTFEHRFLCLNPPVFPKNAGPWMLEWDESSLKEFMDEYTFWDGSFAPNNCRIVFNKSKEHIQWLATFQALTGAGYAGLTARTTGKGSTCFQLKLNNRAFAWFESLLKTEIHVTNVPVFCVSVSTGFFLVRRNDKIMVTGNCYLMGCRKAAQHIFNLSEGSVQVSESDMQVVKDLAIQRYDIPKWWAAMERKLFDQSYPPKLVSPSGHVRMFFGRRADILGQALSHEPQSVTTYATNMAVYRCWTDPENRYKVDGRTKLRVEPLHQVHDEFLCQFRKTDVEWATHKIKEWFNNPITIAGITLTIPFEGAYGTNWAMNDNSKVGSI